ncbi:MAG: prepilin-type N-terminal cleavage/methylation domain-containing protein [Chloroflexi bacterium]|nr:prepilin-type N-terminal cleavage/methylation domain-containing protein [Chloroflexota bacterium]
MEAPRAARGFTLVEVVIALAVTGLLVTTLVAALSLTLTQVPKEGAKLSVENRIQLARYWLTRDANSAEGYTTGTSPMYGTYTWEDYTGETTVTYQAIYYYNPTLKALMRQEKMDGVVQSTVQVAADIQQESHVAFAWSPAQSKVTVTLTPTVLEAPAIGDITRTATVVAWLRYESEPLVSPPGDAPIPPPPPGSEFYYVAANPTVLTGTYVSGNAASLQSVDTDFYIVNSTTGGTKAVAWEAYSQTMSTPATISQIEIRFTGKANRTNVSMNFFVKDASGYPTVADSGFTFTQADTETTHSFYLDPDKVSYINGTRVVYLKVTADGSANFTLSSNQVVFIASP